MSHKAWQTSRRTYDLIAPQFAEINAEMPEELVERAASLLAKVQPGERILDLGCGAGRDLAWFEARKARATGADLSGGMLYQARKITTVPLCQMEMRLLGFATGAFRAVWSIAALLHLPKTDVPLALAEVARVLVPGGLFILSIQEGQSEDEETGPYPGVTRFFARYTAGEMAELLDQSHFRILSQGKNVSRRVWLWYEAVRS